MSQVEYLLRVKASRDGGYTASCRQFAPTAHPEVRAVIGHAGIGHGKTANAAVLAAVINAQIETVKVPRDSRYAC